MTCLQHEKMTEMSFDLPGRKPLHKLLCLLCTFLLSSFLGYAQTNVTGTVRSGDSALAGVSVQVKGTGTATATNSDGSFSIAAPSTGTLVFSYVGFGIREVPVDGRTNVSVVLTPLDGTMSDVVVVGYNSQRKATLTGSVSQVKGADLV